MFILWKQSIVFHRLVLWRSTMRIKNQQSKKKVENNFGRTLSLNCWTQIVDPVPYTKYNLNFKYNIMYDVLSTYILDIRIEFSIQQVYYVVRMCLAIIICFGANFKQKCTVFAAITKKVIILRIFHTSHSLFMLTIACHIMSYNHNNVFI